MKQATLRLNRYAQNLSNVRVVNNNNLQVRILHAMLFSMSALAILYVVILGNMVFNIIERRALEADARSLSNEVGDMELTYLTLSNKVDLALGHSLGFKEAKATFATRKAVGTLNGIKVANNDL